MADDTNWGCGPAGCMTLMIIAFLVMIFIAKQQGMDVPEIFGKFMDMVGR